MTKRMRRHVAFLLKNSWLYLAASGIGSPKRFKPVDFAGPGVGYRAPCIGGSRKKTSRN